MLCQGACDKHINSSIQQKGKPRLVLVCRHVNQYLHAFKIKYEDIKIAEKVFDKVDFLFIQHLKSGYHMLVFVFQVLV